MKKLLFLGTEKSKLKSCILVVDHIVCMFKFIQSTNPLLHKNKQKCIRTLKENITNGNK